MKTIKGVVLHFACKKHYGFIEAKDGQRFFFGRENIDDVMFDYYQEPIKQLHKYNGEVEFIPASPTLENFRKGRREYTATHIKWTPPQMKKDCPCCGYKISPKWSYCPKCGTEQQREE